MKFSPTFNQPQAVHSAQGFTLIELLVVIVIVSIILSMTTLAITTGSADDRLKKESQRFSALLELAMDESLLHSTELGIVFSDQSYQFVQMTEQGWQPVSNNNSLRERQLDTDMELELVLDFEPVALTSTVKKIGDVSKVDDVEKFDDNTDDEFKPQVYLLSSGEIMPSFALTFLISDADIHYEVQALETGALKVQRNGS